MLYYNNKYDETEKVFIERMLSMAILAFDVGGSSVKYAVVQEDGTVEDKGSFKTPSDLEGFYGGRGRAGAGRGGGRMLMQHFDICM